MIRDAAYLTSSVLPYGTPPWIDCRGVRNDAPPEVCGGTDDDPPDDLIDFEPIYDPVLGFAPGVLKISGNACTKKTNYDKIWPRYQDGTVRHPLTRQPFRCYGRQMRITETRWNAMKMKIDTLRNQNQQLLEQLQQTQQLLEQLQQVAPPNLSLSSRGPPQATGERVAIRRPRVVPQIGAETPPLDDDDDNDNDNDEQMYNAYRPDSPDSPDSPASQPAYSPENDANSPAYIYNNNNNFGPNPFSYDDFFGDEN